MARLFFVCQRGPLELKGRILAASLRYFSTDETEIVACVPSTSSLTPATEQTFERIGVQLHSFEPRLWSAYNYPIGNKIDAAVSLAADRSGYSVFLDTDMLAVKAFDSARLCTEDIGAATIFGPQVFTVNANLLLNEFVKSLPDELRSNIEPYDGPIQWKTETFNAGLIVFRTHDIAKTWSEIVEAVLRSDLPSRFARPFADQVGLALMKRHKMLSFRTIPRRWNSTVFTANTNAIIIHYHALLNAFDNELALRTIRALAQKYSDSEVSLLGELSIKDLYRPKQTLRPKPTAEN